MSSSSRRAPRTILFIGISGSGKGTQAVRLARVLRPSYYLEIGKHIRSSSGKPTLGGQRIAATTTRGELIPTWALIALLGHEFMARISPRVHVITDGVPRRLAEARMLDEIMGDTGRSLPLAIYLTLSEREARRRLIKRGRSVDDNPVAIRRRFKWFREEVRPVIGYYRRRGRLITINGDQSMEAVWRDVRRALKLT